MSRWSGFTDDEIYMLKRMAIESSCEIIRGDRYHDDDKQIHTDILNDLIVESKRR